MNRTNIMPLLKVIHFLIYLGIANDAGQIRFCDDETFVGLAICKPKDYNPKAPKPHPLILQETIIVNDIPEFNPDEKTITIFMKLIVYWNDSRIMIKSSDLSK